MEGDKLGGVLEVEWSELWWGPIYGMVSELTDM